MEVATSVGSQNAAAASDGLDFPAVTLGMPVGPASHHARVSPDAAVGRDCCVHRNDCTASATARACPDSHRSA
jgi:hypothetical protein